MTKISIITVNLNNNKGLQRTLNSIQQQSYMYYEHIIIDGASTDGSIETISEYSKTSSHLTYWISEKDTGVYNAMNKGIPRANGKYLLFLNSGDFLEPNILDLISEDLSGEDIIYGDLYCYSNNKKWLEPSPPPPLSTSQILSSTFFLPHPASFIKKELFEKEKYSEHYKVVSDWEFWIKHLLFTDCTVKYLSRPISHFENAGLSSNQDIVNKEREDVLSKLCPSKILESLKELNKIEQSPLYGVFFQTDHANQFQGKMEKLILFCYKIYCVFNKKPE